MLSKKPKVKRPPNVPKLARSSTELVSRGEFDDMALKTNLKKWEEELKCIEEALNVIEKKRNVKDVDLAALKKEFAEPKSKLMVILRQSTLLQKQYNSMQEELSEIQVKAIQAQPSIDKDHEHALYLEKVFGNIKKAKELITIGNKMLEEVITKIQACYTRLETLSVHFKVDTSIEKVMGSEETIEKSLTDLCKLTLSALVPKAVVLADPGKTKLLLRQMKLTHAKNSSLLDQTLDSLVKTYPDDVKEAMKAKDGVGVVVAAAAVVAAANAEKLAA